MTPNERIKYLELRDRATCIPVICVQLSSHNEAERHLLSSAGYGREPENHERYILIARLAGGHGEYTTDPYDWNTHTMKRCHQYIHTNWHRILSGDVIDREFIDGETSEPKRSQRLEYFF